MLSTDLDAFGKLVSALCAAYHVPVTEARTDAFWRSCNAMSLLEFERLVNYILGPDCELDEFPPPRAMHTLHRRMLASQRAAATMAAAAKPEPTYDVFERYTNLVMLRFLREQAQIHGCGASELSLQRMLAITRDYVVAYREHCAGDPSASLELRDRLLAKLLEAFEPATPRASDAAA